MIKDSLGNRMKAYEDAYRIHLPNRMPIILRLDGRAWHSLTKYCKKPFDQDLINCLNETAIYLCKNIQNVKLCYLQSDELSFLIYNPSFEAQSWFDNNLQKMTSISASMASSYFTSISHKVFGETKVTAFDARCFAVPLDEVVNAFEWRQQDSRRNSIQMLARSIFSHKECNNKNCSQLKNMCSKAGIDWDNCPTSQKRGRCIVKIKKETKCFNFHSGDEETVVRSEWIVDDNIPIFSQERDYIDQYVFPKLEKNVILDHMYIEPSEEGSIKVSVEIGDPLKFSTLQDIDWYLEEDEL